MTRPLQASISASALRHNLARVRTQMPGCRIMAAVKANAYGHGALPCARTLAAAGVDALAVASIEEAEALYDAHIEPRCTLLAGPFTPSEITVAAAHGHRLVLHTMEQLQWLQAGRWQIPLDVFIKVDTGMHRLGFAPQDLAEVFALLAQVAAPLQVLGLFSHLARADTPADPYNDRQITCFHEAVAQFGALTLGQHALPNSAGILALPSAQSYWVRPGLMLYGLSPITGISALELDLKPVLRWEGQLLAERQLEAGEWLGYGATWQASQRTRVGVVACGYGDGYDRRLSNGAPVLVNGQPSRTLGRISMDLCFVDLTGLHAAPGDPVLLMGGPELPLEAFAQRLDTIPYELGTRIAQRVPRILVP